MRFPHVRPTVSLAAGGFLVVSASSFGLVTVLTSGHPDAAGGFAATRMSVARSGLIQASQMAAFSSGSNQHCATVKPAQPGGGGTGGSTPPSSSPPSSTSPPPTTPSSGSTGGDGGGGTTTQSPTPTPTTSTPSPSPTDTPTSTPSGTSGSPSGTPVTSSLITPLPGSLTPGNSKQTVGADSFASPEGEGPPVTATLLSFAQADAATSPQLCVSVQRDEASIARGQKAQWNVNVWAKGTTVANVTLKLTATPKGQKPVFSFGCPKEGTAACTFKSVDSQPRQLQAQVAVARTATSVKSVQLTATGSGTRVSGAKASVPIAVTAPRAGASGSASASGAGSASSSSAAIGPVPPPSGATSPLPVGGLPFLNGSGATLAPGLSPGGNASSLFPTLNPSTGAGSLPTASDGGARTRPVADALPADASVMGAQYAGLGALALAFVLSVTRLSIRRRQAAAKSGSTASH